MYYKSMVKIKVQPKGNATSRERMLAKDAEKFLEYVINKDTRIWDEIEKTVGLQRNSQSL